MDRIKYTVSVKSRERRKNDEKDSMRMTTAQFAKLHEVNKRTLLCDADNDPDQGLVFINFLERISTHLLTWLIMNAILRVEQ